jgi:hypothetical protein
MDTWMLCQKRLHFLALVNRRFIPCQYDRAFDMPKQMLQKVNDLLPCQVAAVRLGPQSDPASSRRDQQCPDGVDMLIVLNTGSNLGSLPSRCPSAFDRTDQRLSVFVNKYQGRPQVMPLFLSWATHTASNVQSPDHHVERRRAAASGNSSACAATDARHHWACSVHRTTSGSNQRCEPVSSNPQHCRRHARFSGGSSSAARFAAPLSGMDGRLACGCVVAWLADCVPRVANVGYSGASRRLLPPTRPERGRAAIAGALVLDGRRVAGLFQLVSCPISCHISTSSDISYSKFNSCAPDANQ